MRMITLSALVGHMALLLTSAGACAARRPPEVASAAAPPPSPAKPDALRIERFLSAVRGRKAAVVERMLGETPELADATTEKGYSVFLVALFTQEGEGFVRPQDNAVLADILAAHPHLDALEAAAAGDRARVEREIAGDAGYVRGVHAMGWTALHFAAFAGRGDIVALLLDHGADVNVRAKTEFDNTPLQVALLTAQTEVARGLVARGADVNARQAEGFTALHEAAQTGDAALVKMLLDAGADPSIRGGGKKALSPYDVAHKVCHEDVLTLLRPRAEPPAPKDPPAPPRRSE